MRWLIAVAAFLAMLGCAQNPYKQFYSPIGGQLALPLEPSVGGPQLVQGRDVQQDRLRFLEDGYVPIGYSSFHAGNVDQGAAVAHGAEIGAAVVLVYAKYRNTESGAIPLTLPSTQTSTTNVSGMTGSRSFYGTGTTTTYGSTTTYIPYSVDRSEYLAVYFKKAAPSPFGVMVRDPKPDERPAIGSNAGLVVEVVRKGSPAFRADLFRGDVLMRIGNSELREISDFFQAVRRYQGQSTTVAVMRDGKLIERPISIGNHQ